ncbi:BTB/POZ domain-containing protein 2-like protein [Aphelenchoides avenae]|nr:BTB/POZ domain-containing protein 2-like protein [Aphelenchus avenae]
MRSICRCLDFLDKNAASLTKRPSFLRISHERLKRNLARNSLGINEVDLYRAAIKWARAQLKRANKRHTHQAIREVLGKALLLIRFPIMHPQEFSNGPAKDSILSAEEKLAIYGRIHSAGPTACVFSAEPRTGPSPLPLRNFALTYCQTCGTRLNGDICPECRCSQHSSVECAGCGRRITVDAEAFVWDMCLNDSEECYAVAFRCSCGAPNTTEGHGRVRCRRCGLKVWLCMENERITEEACKCYGCRQFYREDYSDGELTSSEDYSDNDFADFSDGDDGEGDDAR